jgi:phosphatidylglycerol---prolipoprotein diacylglyceryl transferase
MRPILFEVAGISVNSYGVSKALAAAAAWWLLAREMHRRGLNRELAVPLTVFGTVGGFAGAKVYYLLENAQHLTVHDLGGTGFTWFGGLIGGALSVVWVVHRHRLPLGLIAGLVSAPLAIAFGIGRLGCQLAGDGTYGTHTDLPWGMSFPHGTVPTTDTVHPAALYEALAAFAVGGLLWRLRTRSTPTTQFGLFAVLMGASRFLVEFVRLNDKVVAGLTAAQLFSLSLVTVGVALLLRERPTPATATA